MMRKKLAGESCGGIFFTTESCFPTSAAVVGRLCKPFTRPALGTKMRFVELLSPYRRSGIF